MLAIIGDFNIDDFFSNNLSSSEEGSDYSDSVI
jgi:hypothetical protein